MNRKRTLSRFASLALAGAALLVSPAPSRAYKVDNGSGVRVNCDNLTGLAHWNQRNISWYHNTQGHGAGKGAALTKALEAWSAATGNISDTSFSLSLAGPTLQGSTLTDNQNTFIWANQAFCGTEACHAITFLDVNATTKEITEADIVFNNSLNWTTADNTPATNCLTVSTAPIDVQAIATHELGHSLGIHHPDAGESSYSTATMGAQSCNVEGRTLTSDDKEALRCLEDRYPVNPAYEGFHEVGTCSTLSGWAWNANRPNRPIYVELREGSNTKAVVKAGNYRADLVSAGKGNGQHGFSVPTNVNNDGAKHTIYARFNNSGLNMYWTPKELACGVAMFDGKFPAETPDTGGVYTVGTRFSSSQAGKIKELWYFKATGETQTGQLRLWTDVPNSPDIAWVPNPTCRTNSGSPKGQWCGGPVISAVPISANTLYRVGVVTHTKQAKSPCGTTNSLSSPILKWPLTAHQGVSSSGNTYPATLSCDNFFVDVRFDS